MLHYRAAETVVQDVVFNSANDLDAASEKFERAGIHRFDPTRIDERDGNSFFFELARGFFGNLEHRAEAEDRDVAPMLYDLGLANLQEPRFWFYFCARS